MSEREPSAAGGTADTGRRGVATGAAAPSRSENAGHGRTYPLTADDLTAPDADVRLVWADMDAWADAHPCECEAICTCEGA